VNQKVNRSRPPKPSPPKPTKKSPPSETEPAAVSRLSNWLGLSAAGDWTDYSASSIALVIANLLPLLGVVFLHWDAFAIVALYWTENVVIGAINILKMVTCSPRSAEVDWSQFQGDKDSPEMRATLDKLRSGIAGGAVNHHLTKLFFIPFFTFHYGLFCFVHGMFVVALLGPGGMSGFHNEGPLSEMLSLFGERHLWWWAAALAASHVYSFFVNYLGHGEYRRTVVPALMIQPYARVVLLHLALLFGGFVAVALSSNIAVLTILVLGKTAMDLRFHLSEHERIDRAKKRRSETILEESPRS
jgi:hypothetical protein